MYSVNSLKAFYKMIAFSGGHVCLWDSVDLRLFKDAVSNTKVI